MTQTDMTGHPSPEVLAFRLKLAGKLIHKQIFVSAGSIPDKAKVTPSIQKLLPYNVAIFATEGTSKFLEEHGVPNTRVYKISEGKEPNARSLLDTGTFDFVVNILTGDNDHDENSDARQIRSAAIRSHLPLITDADVAIDTIEQLIADVEKESARGHVDEWDMRSYFQRLVLRRGGYASYHAHLDKAYLMTPDRLALGQIDMQMKWDLYARLKHEYTFEDLYTRIERGIQAQISQGVTHFRTLIDADPVIGLKGIHAALAVREKYKNHIVFEIGTQPLQGVLNPEVRRVFEEACSLVDVVGGLPSKDRPTPEKHLDVIFGIAKEQGKRLDVHVDQENNPEEDETELLARKTIEHGMEGQVSAIHAIFSSKPVHKQVEISKMLADAGISVIVCPSAALSMKPREEFLAPIHNSIAPIERLRNAGVHLVFGTDNIYDFFMPFTDGDMYTEVRVFMEAARWYEAEAIADIACDKSLFRVA